MFETPEDEAKKFDGTSKANVIPVHCSRSFRENKASFLAFRVRVITSHRAHHRQNPVSKFCYEKPVSFMASPQIRARFSN